MAKKTCGLHAGEFFRVISVIDGVTYPVQGQSCTGLKFWFKPEELRKVRSTDYKVSQKVLVKDACPNDVVHGVQTVCDITEDCVGVSTKKPHDSLHYCAGKLKTCTGWYVDPSVIEPIFE